MTDDVAIVPFDPSHAADIGAWAGQHAMHTLFKLPSVVASSPNSTLAWVALKKERPIGIVTVTRQHGAIGQLDVMVKPSEQRQGIGSQLVAHALTQPDVQAFSHVRAHIPQDSLGAQKVLTRKGFSRTGYTEDGLLEFEKH